VTSTQQTGRYGIKVDTLGSRLTEHRCKTCKTTFKALRTDATQCPDCHAAAHPGHETEPHVERYRVGTIERPL
jgi:Zn finger protein HypA/HybF involved in hydrogenase expression